MSRQCQDCKKGASFNYEGETKRLYCKDHMKSTMVNVASRKCKHPTCTTQPRFNFPNTKGGIFCSEHQETGMVNVVDLTCKKCNKSPVFNYDGCKKPEYCDDHKEPGMVNIKSKKCEHPRCTKQPCFNYTTEKKGKYCFDHKKPGMINIKDKLCQYSGCNKLPVYNFKGEIKRLYCRAHRKVGMINIKDKLCHEYNCPKRPNYNYEGLKNALYCFDHRKANMINIKSPRCKTPLCSTIVNKRYEGYCLPCFVHMFPDKPNSRNYKTKERAVAEYVLKEFPDKTWVADKRVADGCSRRRPDLCLDMGSHLIMVEVDENQHMDYDCSCENKRLMELSRDVGHRPIVFVRFNPDDYKQSDKSITSCWGMDKKGMCVIKKSKTTEWDHRLACLKEQIHYWVSNMPEKTVECVQLFFDV